MFNKIKRRPNHNSPKFVIETDPPYVQTIKLISYCIIPIILAIGGWYIQQAIANQSIKSEYLKIAINILTLPKESVDKPIRDWAVDLVVQNSPISFSQLAIEQLKSGDIVFPSNDNQSGDIGIAVYPGSEIPAGSKATLIVHTSGGYKNVQAIRIVIDGKVLIEKESSGFTYVFDTTGIGKGLRCEFR